MFVFLHILFFIRLSLSLCSCLFFFFNDTATTEIYTLSLHDALPICDAPALHALLAKSGFLPEPERVRSEEHTSELQSHHDLVCRLLLEKKKRRRRRCRPSSELRQRRAAPASSWSSSWSASTKAQVLPFFWASATTCSASFFFFNDTATTEIYTLSLHDALPISGPARCRPAASARAPRAGTPARGA